MEDNTIFVRLLILFNSGELFMAMCEAACFVHFKQRVDGPHHLSMEMIDINRKLLKFSASLALD